MLGVKGETFDVAAYCVHCLEASDLSAVWKPVQTASLKSQIAHAPVNPNKDEVDRGGNKGHPRRV